MVINPELSLLDESARVDREPNTIVKRTALPMSIQAECVAGCAERRIRINPAVPRIPYLLANFMNAKIAIALATRSKGWE